MRRGVFAFAICVTCWLWMQIIHELGHALATLYFGGQVELVYLVPWDISRTDFHAPQHELPIIWAGPIFGALVPAIVWLTLRLFKSSQEPLAAFFAGFCLIANGAYLGAAVFLPVGDAAEILKLGGASWQLALFGVVCVPLGLWLWNGRGGYFGFGQGAQTVTSRGASIAAGVLVGTLALETIGYLLFVA
ncbi:hypothetical protein LOC68_27380 [Blastopirellula sp. JC732]|uniref:M50 family peptidase n=1 Tax=Blastopirellula sediminis TaxID=2894196 RepID=A0A9X1MV15_9BACT|nr:hypothetical protein [Blastopirellula sediminis]MCC9604567.1 hypothetical protein [Blastopirellula sediminis]MCC9632134.1 hypothetical protein [Blastopirellula sediminis]